MAELRKDFARELEQILRQDLPRGERIAWLEALLQREKEALEQQQREKSGTPTQPLSLNQLASLLADSVSTENENPLSTDSRPDLADRSPSSLTSLQERIRQETLSFEFDALIGGISKTNDPALAACSPITPASEERHETCAESDGGADMRETRTESVSPDAKTLRLMLPTLDNQNPQIQTLAGTILSVANDAKSAPDAPPPVVSPAEANRLFTAHAELKHRLDSTRRRDRIRAGIVAGVISLSLLTVIVLIPILTYRAWTLPPSRQKPVSSAVPWRAQQTPSIRAHPLETTPSRIDLLPSIPPGSATDRLSASTHAGAPRPHKTAVSALKPNVRSLPKARASRPKRRIPRTLLTRRAGPVAAASKPWTPARRTTSPPRSSDFDTDVNKIIDGLP